jgi:hypothetical protein
MAERRYATDAFAGREFYFRPEINPGEIQGKASVTK